MVNRTNTAAPSRNILVVDVTQTEVAMKVITDVTGSKELHDRLLLKMPDSSNNAKNTPGGKNPWEQFMLLLEKTANEEDLDLAGTTVILGCNSDPFLPFQGKFDTSLKIVEYLARLRPALLCVQTRSPLVVLTLPILKALGQHVVANISLETRQDALNNHSRLGLPRPSERIKAAKILSKAGVPVLLQVVPPSTETDLAGYALMLSELRMHVCFGQKEEPRDSSDNMGRDRSRTLKKYFSKVAGTKVVENIYEDWLSPALSNAASREEVACEAA
jgi:hypothetical protein